MSDQKLSQTQLNLDAKVQRGDWNAWFTCDVSWYGILGVAGRSGAGKTSLLRTLAGLEKSVSGNLQVRHDNWVINKISMQPEKRNVGMVFQDSRLFPHLTVAENLKLAASKQGEKLTQFEVLIEEFGVRPLLQAKPEQLSGGQQQRVALVRGLVNQPRMILLDEPFSSLDRVARGGLLPKLRKISENWHLPMVFVSHAIEELCVICDRVLLIQDGRIITHDEPMTLFSEPKYSHWFDDIAGAVMRTRVERFDSGERLLLLSVGKQTLTVPSEQDRVGEELHIRIPAHEVILARQPIQHSSLQNALSCEVRALYTESGGQVMCQLAVEDQHLLALITHRAAKQLQLVVGDQIYAHIKAMSLIGNK